MTTLNDLLSLECLPTDWRKATLVGRAWLPGKPAGPSPVALRSNGEVVDLAAVEPTDLRQDRGRIGAILT